MVFKHLIVESANVLLRMCLSAMVAPLLRLFGASIGSNARIYSPLICHSTRFSHLTIGDDCHIGRGVFLDMTEQITIGDRATVSMGTTILTHVDVGDADVSIEPESKPTTISDGAYIGANATILHGVTIGAGAVVAAGAVVTRDVSPGERVGGVPARTLTHPDAVTPSA